MGGFATTLTRAGGTGACRPLAGHATQPEERAMSAITETLSATACPSWCHAHTPDTDGSNGFQRLALERDGLSVEVVGPWEDCQGA